MTDDLFHWSVVIDGEDERPHLEAAAQQAEAHADDWLREALIGFLVNVVSDPDLPSEGTLATDARTVLCGVEPWGDYGWEFTYRLEMTTLELWGPS